MYMAYFYALVAAIFWGVGFIGSRYGLQEIGPFWLTFFRFLVASVALVPFILKIKGKSFNISLFKGSFICSIFLTALITFQIAGLQYTTVAKSGFITILYAFFTPLICYFLFKKKISQRFWVYLGLAFVGMLLISELSLAALNYGDFLTLLCAFASSFHIICISHFSKEHDNSLFNFMQLLFVAVISLPLAVYFEGIPKSLSSLSILSNSYAVGGIVFMGVFSTSIAFFLQVKSQQKIPAHVAGLIFLLESPLAAILGYISFNESMSGIAMFGSFLVILSVGLMPFDVDMQRIKTQAKFNLIRFARMLTMIIFGR